MEHGRAHELDAQVFFFLSVVYGRVFLSSGNKFVFSRWRKREDCRWYSISSDEKISLQSKLKPKKVEPRWVTTTLQPPIGSVQFWPSSSTSQTFHWLTWRISSIPLMSRESRLVHPLCVFVYVVFTGRGRDECPPSGGEHSPASPCFAATVSTGWWSTKNHRCFTETELVVSLKTTSETPCCWPRLRDSWRTCLVSSLLEHLK